MIFAFKYSHFNCGIQLLYDCKFTALNTLFGCSMFGFVFLNQQNKTLIKLKTEFNRYRKTKKRHF